MLLMMYGRRHFMSISAVTKSNKLSDPIIDDLIVRFVIIIFTVDDHCYVYNVSEACQLRKSYLVEEFDV